MLRLKIKFSIRPKLSAARFIQHYLSMRVGSTSRYVQSINTPEPWDHMEIGG